MDFADLASLKGDNLRGKDTIIVTESEIEPTLWYWYVLRGRGIQPHAASVLGSWGNSHVTRGVGVISGVVYSTHHVGVSKPRGMGVDWPASQICWKQSTGAHTHT